MNPFPSKSKKNTTRRVNPFAGNSADGQKLRWRFLAVADELGSFKRAWQWRDDICDWPYEGINLPDEAKAREWWRDFTQSDKKGAQYIPPNIVTAMRRRIEQFKAHTLTSFIVDAADTFATQTKLIREGNFDAKNSPVLQHLKDAVTYGTKNNDTKVTAPLRRGSTKALGKKPEVKTLPPGPDPNMTVGEFREVPVANSND